MRPEQVLEAKALQEDPPELIDYSKPDIALMQSRAGAAIEAYKVTRVRLLGS